ncbi:MAG: isochorismatase family protein [Nanoarchaeota archaeon]|nr:isochorismatase family protein [Nanoarchaeota archaeon]
MKIPHSGRKKALIIVDVQPAFMNKRNKYILKNIVQLLKTISYDFYANALFHAEKGSLWDKQQKWVSPKDNNFSTVPEIMNLLKGKNHLAIEKTTKSVFKGDKDIFILLKDKGIEEVHLVGFDTNDCILASAYEAFDLGFFTYIIEECCESSSSAALHKQGLALLRKQNMTNNSVIEKIHSTNL